MISTNFLEYYGIVGAVPKGWKKLISEYGRLHDIKNDIIDRLKSEKKPCKYFYKLYLENIKEISVRPFEKERVCGSYSMGKFELKVLKFSISCCPKRGGINIPPIIYLYS
jgi:hypothetical protein